MRTLDPVAAPSFATLSCPPPHARRLDALALRARSGDPAAANDLAGALFVALRPALRRRLRRLQEADLDDVVQEMVLAAIEVDVHRFDPTLGSFLTFVSQRMRWRVADVLRTPPPPPSLDEDDAIDPVDPGLGTDERGDCERREHVLLHAPALVAAAVHKLRDRQARRAITRCDLNGESLTRVARAMRLHPSNASRARRRGLDLLAQVLPPALRWAA